MQTNYDCSVLHSSFTNATTDSTLPTIAEVLACEDRLSRSDATNTVVKLRDGIAVKYGYQVSGLEAQNLSYLHSAGIPVPKVLATFVEPETDRRFIVMEHVEGRTLESLMNELTGQEMLQICQRIQEALKDVRALSSPGYIGSLDQQPCYDGMFYTGDEHDSLVSGPFTSERDMKLGLLKNVARLVPATYADLLSDALCPDAESARIVFTHGDLQPKNILIRKLDTDMDVNPFQITIIDWEFSGWYPDYWEFFNANVAARVRHEWLAMVRNILPTPIKEWPILELIRGILLC